MKAMKIAQNYPLSCEFWPGDCPRFIPPTSKHLSSARGKQAVTGGTGCCKSPCSHRVISPVAVNFCDFFVAGDCVKICQPCNILHEKKGDNYHSERPQMPHVIFFSKRKSEIADFQMHVEHDDKEKSEHLVLRKRS